MTSPPPDPGSAPPPESPARAATFRQTASAVLWSLFGVRKRREAQKDVRLHPVHVVVMGLVGGLVFVLTLLLIVRIIVRSA
jgi:hypothetical protein